MLMKKISLILILSVCSLLAHGQRSGFGIRFGPNLSNVTDIDEKAQSKLAFHAGVFYIARFSDKFRLRPEVEYSVQGAKDEIESLDANFDLELTVNYNYVNFRLLADFRLFDKLSLQAGPQFGILTLAQLKTDVSKENLTEEFSSSTDISIAMGLGYRLSDRIDLNLRYNLGMTELVDESVRNSVFQLGFGFLL